MPAAGTPVVFVHGLWLHASSWGPWSSVFEEAGYGPSAPGWPGEPDTVEKANADPESVAGHGIDDVVAHYAEFIRGLDAKPVVVGHSFGGLIVQRLLGEDLAAAAVAIDAAPIKGVLYLPPSSLRVASVALRNPANRNKAVSLTEKQWRYGFGNRLSENESNALYKQCAAPSPGRTLFEAATANLSRKSPAAVNTRNDSRGPLLLIGGGHDHTVPASITRQTLRLYHKSHAVTDIKVFPDRGHSLCIDSRWREVADAALAWLDSRL